MIDNMCVGDDERNTKGGFKWLIQVLYSQIQIQGTCRRTELTLVVVVGEKVKIDGGVPY